MKPSGTSAEAQQKIVEGFYSPTFAEQEVIAMTPVNNSESKFRLRVYDPSNETT